MLLIYTFGAFVTECMMNTFSGKPLLQSIYKFFSAFTIVVCAAAFKNPYLIFMLLCLSFSLTAIQSENKIWMRIALSIIGGMFPTVSLIYLSLYTKNIDFTHYNCFFFFLAFTFLLFGITRYKTSKTAFLINCLIPALVIFCISLGRFGGGSSGGWISFPWDWLVSLSLFGFLGLECIAVFFWAFYKYKKNYNFDEKTIKAPVLVVVAVFLAIAVAGNIFNHIQSYGFYVQEKQNHANTYDISAQMEYIGTEYTHANVIHLINSFDRLNPARGVEFENNDTCILIGTDDANEQNFVSLPEWKYVFRACVIFSIYKEPQKVHFIFSHYTQREIYREDIERWFGKGFEFYLSDKATFKQKVLNKLDGNNSDNFDFVTDIYKQLEDRNSERFPG